MTTKKEQMMEMFQERENMLAKDSSLSSRIYQAEDNIVNLQNEYEKLKSQRPALLADGKDISKLNKRLKKIEEDIELNKDTIIGVKAKREELQSNFTNIKYKSENACIEYINEILDALTKKYTKIAVEFAEILTEYITLEDIRTFSRTYNNTQFNTDAIRKIPNLSDKDKPIFQYNYYKICGDNRKTIMEKYNIPDLAH